MLMRPATAAQYASYAQTTANHPSLFISDSERYRWMFHEFNSICAKRPLNNRCAVARDVGAKAFDISLEELATSRRLLYSKSHKRQKIIAFTLLVSGISARAVAAAFGLRHSTCQFALKKYGPRIQRVIDECQAQQGATP